MCGGVIEDIGSGISDVASGVGDAVSGAVSGVSDALASIDPGPAIGQAAASIDPGPAVGEALASVDQVVNELPGGWALPAAIAATIAAPYAAPLFAEAAGAGALAGEAGALTTAEILGGAGGAFVPTAGSSFTLPAFEALGSAALESAAPSLLDAAATVASDVATPSLFSSAEIASNVSTLAEYGLAPEQISLALQAEGIPAAVANQAAGFAGAEIGAIDGVISSTFGEVIPSQSATDALSKTVMDLASSSGEFTIPATNQLTNASLVNYAPGYADAIGYVPSSTVNSIATGVGNVPGVAIGSAIPAEFGINAALPAQLVPGGGFGISSALAPQSILGSGLAAGGDIGTSYLLGANGAPAADMFGNLIKAGSGFGGFPAAATGLGLLDLLGNPFGKLLTGNLAKGLLGGGAGGRAAALQQLGQGSTYNPRGAVDYSGILGLISPQLTQKQTSRTSLLG